MHVSLSSVRGTVLSAMFVAFSTPVVFAQTTGRSVSLIAPPVVAATASFEVTFPPAYSISSFNILGWWTIAEYSPTALPVLLPWQNQGLYRGGMLLELIPWSAGPVSNAARLDLAVPHNSMLAGYAFDLQTIDLTLPRKETSPMASSAPSKAVGAVHRTSNRSPAASGSRGTNAKHPGEEAE